MVPSLFPHLLSPLRLGAFELAHRAVVPARCSGLPMAQMPAHYARFSTPGGLLIVEATLVSPAGPADAALPGIHTAEQVNHWRAVSAAIHAHGGIALLQLSLSAIEREALRQRDDDAIDRVLHALRNGAENAGDAGFDGVELLDSGGELVEEMLATLAGVWGGERVGLCSAADPREGPVAYLHRKQVRSCRTELPLLLSGLTLETGEQSLADGLAAAIGLNQADQLARLFSDAAPRPLADPASPSPR
jgi:hypothetical protein